jgi:hypothetical protein
MRVSQPSLYGVPFSFFHLCRQQRLQIIEMALLLLHGQLG